MKRFWDSTSVEREASGAGWLVLLDGRPVRLPGGAPLLLPGGPLAHALAAEWQVAGDAKGGEMSYADVPLTRIAGTAQERIEGNLEPMVLELAQYAEADLLCYRAIQPQELVELQADAWQPWLDWAERRYGGKLLLTQGVVHLAQPSQSLAAFAVALSRMHPLTLAALGILVPAMGSLVLALAVTEGALDASAAFALATLDERYQEGLWGQDDQALTRRLIVGQDVADAARFLTLLRQ
jgi:chaperone required for assembly of F1-ATPase